MFTSRILRNAAVLSSHAARQSAPRSVSVAINTNAFTAQLRAYAHKSTNLLPWAAFLGTVMGWPFAAEALTKAFGDVDNVLQHF